MTSATTTPILFVDRDGTLILEPEDYQIDAYDKLAFVDGVIPAMLRLRDAGYQFVMVTNQDGLGTEAFPREAFDGPHRLMLQVFESQGIRFRDVLIDTSFEREALPTRKPGIGLAIPLLKDRSIDWSRSAMVGDRDSDVKFADNLGIRSFKLASPQFGSGATWPQIAHALADAPRTAEVVRNTRETRIRVGVDLDREADAVVSTGIGFFDHMLEQLGKHGGFSLTLRCDGDLRVDEHHTVEDCAIALGQALRQAVGDKRGIARYGFVLPMDEARAGATLDWAGRSCFVFAGRFHRERVGELATELVPHFFGSLCDAAGLNLHLEVSGDNDHHMIEACFKAVARALRQSFKRDGDALPSTKGAL